MSTTDDRPAAASGTFTLGEDLAVTRLGFGAMRITGEGIWGMPDDVDNAIAVLRRAVDLGVDLIDTADSYGPNVSEDLIREALHPYDGVVVATKGGLTRQGPGEWRPVGRPEYVAQCIEMSLRRLDVEAAQAHLDALGDVLGPTDGSPLAGALPGQPALGGHHHAVVGVQRLADQVLRHVGPVAVGGVDEVHAEVDGATQDRDRVVDVIGHPPDALTGDAHRPEAEAGHRQVLAEGEGAARRGRSVIGGAHAAILP